MTFPRPGYVRVCRKVGYTPMWNLNNDQAQENRGRSPTDNSAKEFTYRSYFTHHSFFLFFFHFISPIYFVIFNKKNRHIHLPSYDLVSSNIKDRDLEPYPLQLSRKKKNKFEEIINSPSRGQWIIKFFRNAHSLNCLFLDFINFHYYNRSVRSRGLRVFALARRVQVGDSTNLKE